MSEVSLNLGPYIVSFDTGITDVYKTHELETDNRETEYKTNNGIILVKYTVYKAIITNEAKNDGIYIQLRQYDQQMEIGSKRELLKDPPLDGLLQGFCRTKINPCTIDGMGGIIVLLKPPDKKDISLGKYCRAKLRGDTVYAGGYWPDESKQGPTTRNFSVWCLFISTYPWDGGAGNLFDSFKVRNVT